MARVPGLTQGIDRATEQPFRADPGRRARGGSERDQPETEGVATVRCLAHVTAVDEGAQQPVGREQLHSRGRGDLADRQRAAPGGDDLEQAARAMHRLDSAGSAAGLLAEVEHQFVTSSAWQQPCGRFPRRASRGAV